MRKRIASYIQIKALQNITFENQTVNIYKNNGLFDINDFSVRIFLTLSNNLIKNFQVFSVYGNDYLFLRKMYDNINKENEFFNKKKLENTTSKFFDVIDLFINQTQIHVLRTIEPSIKLRYQKKTCQNDKKNLNFISDQNDFKKECKINLNNLGTKNQLANLFFHNIQIGSTFDLSNNDV